MDLPTLASKVRTSRLLTEKERAYWTQNLPRMSAEQCAKLDTILSRAESLPWNAQMQTYMSLAGKATKALAA